MFKKKDKSLLDITWATLFKKIKDRDQCKVLVDYDGLDILIDSQKNIKVSHQDRITEKVSNILEDIKTCAGDLTKEKLPLRLRLIGPGCSSHIKVARFYVIIDPEKPKAIHSFEGRVSGAKLIHSEYVSESDVDILISEVKRSLEIPSRVKLRSTIRKWIISCVNRSKDFTEKEKQIVLTSIERRFTMSPDSPINSTHRNDMQERRTIARIESDLLRYVRKIMSPAYGTFMKNILTKMQSTMPVYIGDRLAEFQVINAKTKSLKDAALRANRSKAKFSIESFGLENLDQNPINTLLPGVLFILKEPQVNITLGLLPDIWEELANCTEKVES